MSTRRTISLLLGAGLWFAVLAAIASSLHTIRARVSRPVRTVMLEAAVDSGLAAGDSVFLQSETGLRRIGEVSEVADDAGLVLLAIEPDAFARLDASTRARYWKTPLSAEDALSALLPEGIRKKVLARIAEDWRTAQEDVVAAWEPIARELTISYLRAIRNDIQGAFRHREAELWEVAKVHGRDAASRWPTVQERLVPILQEHLTPVLSRLMAEALAEAPRMSIAWQLARGNTSEAFRRTLDWLADFLAEMSDDDREELNDAVRKTWEEARDDPVVAAELAALGDSVLDDQRLWDLVSDIYRESVTNNPRTSEFLRLEVLESPRVREQLYAFVESFAPTARSVLALCLFDADGATRPEAVHLVRALALRRRVAWVTLHTTGASTVPLEPGATLRAESGDARR